jgi:hypothetical protein
MADLLYEHFDTLTPAQMASTQAWATVGSGVVLTTGRNGQGVTGTSGATVAQNTLRSKVLTAYGRGYFGLALKWASFPAVATAFWALLDTSGSPLLTLACGPTGTISVYAGTAGGTLLGTSGVLFSGGGTWDYLEVGPVIGSSGSVEIRVRADGVGTATKLYTRSAVDTQPGTFSAWAQTELYLSDLVVLDDLYVSDSAVPRNTYFKGRCRILAAVPIADAYNLGGWTPSSGQYPLIDDVPHTDDADYLYARVGAIARWQMTALASDADVVCGVQVTAIVRQVSSSELQSLAVWIHDPSSYPRAFVVATLALIPTAYRAFSYVSNFRPAVSTTSDWGTVANVNVARFGFSRS